MKKRIITLAGLMALSCALAVGCGNSTSQTETQSAAQTEAASETQVQTEETQEAESAAETTADTEATEAAATLEDGTYTADFNTDSSMFQVNEMYDGKGTLTVKDGKMTIHITLRSTNIVNLYPGLAEDAQAARDLEAMCGRFEKKVHDLELTRTIAEHVSIPVIASGGAGKIEHFKEALTEGKADAALAASLFHYKELEIRQVKEYLQREDVPVRL